MKKTTKFAFAGLLVALLAGCKTVPLEQNYGRMFTGKVVTVNNFIGLARSRDLLARNHIDMSQNDLAAVQAEMGFTSNIHAAIIAPKSAHLQSGDFVEFQNATRDREYSILTRVIQRAGEKGPCQWAGSAFGRNAGVECK